MTIAGFPRGAAEVLHRTLDQNQPGNRAVLGSLMVRAKSVHRLCGSVAVDIDALPAVENSRR
jgi:hypothetical protein